MPKKSRMYVNYQLQLRHKDAIAVGDMIERDGKLVTVCRKDITNGFMGVCLFGDSYNLGYLPVRMAVLKKADICLQGRAA